eukprot:669381-Karenia_brevis.AAC.1
MSWHVGAVHTFVPSEHWRKVKRFENLIHGEDSEDEGEYEETVSLPSLESSDEEEVPIEVPTEVEIKEMIRNTGRRIERKKKFREGDEEPRK